MARTYWILIGKTELLADYELIFGDYDKEVVKQELEDTKTSGDCEYRYLKVVRVPGDTTTDINNVLTSLRRCNLSQFQNQRSK